MKKLSNKQYIYTIQNKNLFKLYLAYTDLILVFKIDLIAISITSQLIDAKTLPLTYLLYYAGITFLIHLPSMLFSEK